MFLSTIIPTMGRPTLDTAVNSVLNQKAQGFDFEIIVVNDSGLPLPPSTWQQSERVRVIHTNRTERSVARNTGAAVSRGAYLHFLDDDDWIQAGSLQRLFSTAKANNSGFVYGGARMVENNDALIHEIHLRRRGNCFIQMMSGEWVPTGSYIVKRDVFFRIGGFTPLMSVYEDFDFARRAALEVDFDYIDSSVLSILRGDNWQTTTERRKASLIREVSLAAREKILNHQGAMRRGLDSADSRYWKGHLVRLYLSSFIWNIRVRYWSQALMRAMQTISTFIRSGFSLLSAEYWRGLTQPHHSTKVNTSAA